MSAEQNLRQVSRLPDADMQAAPVALARAALRARELAARTGTPLVVVREGRVVEVDVASEPASSASDFSAASSS